MTDKELKKLSRAELLQLLVEQSRQTEQLQAELDEVKKSADVRKIDLDEAGNIAEAALKINHVFEDAQAAAQQYLENIQSLSARQEEVSAKREAESKAQIDQMMFEAQEKEQATLEKCKSLREETIRECQAMEKDSAKKCEDMEKASQEKCKLLDQATEDKCRQLEKETSERCQELVKSTQDRCTKQVEEAKKKSEAYWTEVVQKLENYMKERDGLKTLLSGIGITESK